MEDEHRALVDVERLQRDVELIERFAARDHVGLLGLGALELLRDAAVDVLRVAAAVAAPLARDAQHDLEEPRARSMSALLVIAEAAMRDHEDLLHAVLDVGGRHAEAPQVAPHERDVTVVERPEIERAVHRSLHVKPSSARIESNPMLSPVWTTLNPASPRTSTDRSLARSPRRPIVGPTEKSASVP